MGTLRIKEPKTESRLATRHSKSENPSALFDECFFVTDCCPQVRSKIILFHEGKGRRQNKMNFRGLSCTSIPRRTQVDVSHDRHTMRSLLGGAKEKLVHDPGAEGPEGEGEAAMTMMVLVYAVALGLFIYGTTAHRRRNARSRLAATAPHPELRPPRRSPRRGGRMRTRREPRRDPRRDPRPARRRPARRVLAAPTNAKKNICDICRCLQSARIDFSETGASYESLDFSQATGRRPSRSPTLLFPLLPISILFTTPQRNS